MEYFRDPMKPLYFDYAATTPVDPRVVDAMNPFHTDVFYNASSSHKGGLEAQKAVMKSRMTIAKHIGSKMSEIYFTSGATEAINLAIQGVTNLADAGKSEAAGTTRHKIVTVGTEHAAVLDTIKHVENRNWDVAFLPVDSDGRVDLAQAEELICEKTLLVCAMAVNNETGVIQDLKPLSEIAHRKGTLFMTDATQAYGKIPIDVNELGIDFMTFSGHKIYGPKGVGVLYRRNPKAAHTDLEPLQFGGGQEEGVRCGTLNVPGIVGMAEAGEIAHREHAEESSRVSALRDMFEKAVRELDGVSINGEGAPRQYNISNVLFANTDVDAMLFAMDHVCCSKGSACSSTKARNSHVLTTMGRTDEQAGQSIRFSFGRFTTKEEVDRLVADVTAAHEKAHLVVT